MGLRQIGYLYLFMLGLVYVSLREGSLPREFDMSFAALFLYFFTLLTLCAAGLAYLTWRAGRK